MPAPTRPWGGLPGGLAVCGVFYPLMPELLPRCLPAVYWRVHTVYDVLRAAGSSLSHARRGRKRLTCLPLIV